MKMRNGFVSNSSSSSFLIIGVEEEWGGENIRDIMEKDGLDRDGYLGHGCLEGKYLMFYGFDGEPVYYGLDVEDELETKTVNELRDEFIEYMKKHFFITLDEKSVRLHYGQANS